MAERVHSHKCRRHGSLNGRLARRLDRTCKGSRVLSVQAGGTDNGYRATHVLMCSGMLENAKKGAWRIS